MIGPPPGVRVWLAAGASDMRRGFDGLARLVQEVLGRDPFSGHVFAFRGKRGHLVKLLFWDGQGLCLYAKRLDRGGFVWPNAQDGVVSLTPAQLSILLEGIDWRTLAWTAGRRSRDSVFALARRDVIGDDSDVAASLDIAALPGDPALLVEVLAERDDTRAARDALEAQNDRLRHILPKLQRHQFGRKSERLPKEQLELGLADLETAIAKSDAEAEKRDPELKRERTAKRRGARPARAVRRRWWRSAPTPPSGWT